MTSGLKYVVVRVSVVRECLLSITIWGSEYTGSTIRLYTHVGVHLHDVEVEARQRNHQSDQHAQERLLRGMHMYICCTCTCIYTYMYLYTVQQGV